MLTQALKVLRTADFAPVIVFIAAPSVVTVGDVPCANVSLNYFGSTHVIFAFFIMHFLLLY